MEDRLWEMINNIQNLHDVKRVEIVIITSNVDIDVYDELMAALSYIRKELCYKKYYPKDYDTKYYYEKMTIK